MKKLIKIFDIRDIPGKGRAIIGSNTELDGKPKSYFSHIVGKEIVIRVTDGTTLSSNVKEVSAWNSFSDTLILAILLPVSFTDNIEIGSEVFVDFEM